MNKLLPAIVIIIFLIIICYFYIDIPVVYFFHDNNFRQYTFLHKIQQFPELLILLTPIAILIYLIQFKRKKLSRFIHFLLLAAISVLTIQLIKEPVKYCFGRYWPDTFTNNNYSLIHDNKYGFNFFTGGSGYQSFPSGHTATTFAFFYMVYVFYPKLKWLCLVIAFAVVFSLLALYYHFVSDVIAGALMGILISYGIYSYYSRKVMLS